MAIDVKYGRVTTEHGSIGEDEPVVVFRARDILLPEVLAFYMRLCRDSGAGESHLRIINSAIEFVNEWQTENAVRMPDS
jgi:hypothetical protein